MFMLAETLPRFIAVRYLDLSTLTVEADVTGDDFAGYDEWSRTLDEREWPEQPAARPITDQEWLRIIGEEPAEKDVVNSPPVSARPRKPFDQAGRDERGRELAARAVICGAGSVYLCTGSDPKASPYTVDLAAGVCSCPDMGRVLRAREEGIAARCKHQVAVETIVRERVAS